MLLNLTFLEVNQCRGDQDKKKGKSKARRGVCSCGMMISELEI